MANIHGDLLATENGYKTCDLYLAAFFQAAGCTIKRTTRDPKEVYFHFENNDIVGRLKDNYFLRQAPVDALTYADNVKSLKSLCASLMASEPRRA